jgi:thiol-disulfide isomerase/thioredoxin
MRWYCTALVALLLTWSCATSSPAAHESDGVKLGEFIPAQAPQPAPEISFADIDGKAVALGDFHGDLVLVNLWATWCQPCVREMPSLARLQEKLGAGLTLLAISEDRGGVKTVQPFLQKLGLEKLKVYIDPKSDVGHAFKVRGLPTTLVIDGDGDVLGRVEGAADWDSPKMLAILQPLVPASRSDKLLKGAWVDDNAPKPIPLKGVPLTSLRVIQPSH